MGTSVAGNGWGIGLRTKQQTSTTTKHGKLNYLFRNGPTPASFPFIFVFSNIHYKCASSKRCRDSHSQPLSGPSIPEKFQGRTFLCKKSLTNCVEQIFTEIMITISFLVVTKLHLPMTWKMSKLTLEALCTKCLNGPLPVSFSFYSVIFKQTVQFLQQITMNVNNTGIRTHEPLTMTLLP